MLTAEEVVKQIIFRNEELFACFRKGRGTTTGEN